MIKMKIMRKYIVLTLCVTIISLSFSPLVSAKTISKHNLLDEYSFTIIADKTGIMTISNTVKNEVLWVGGKVSVFDGSAYYGWTFGSVENEDLSVKCLNPDYEFDWYLNQGYDMYARRTKNYKFFVRKGEKIRTEFYGNGYSFDFSYGIKSYVVKKTKIKTINKKNRKVYISWKKIKNVKGYDVQISTNKKFKRNTYQHTYKKTKMKGMLKSGKKYFVRVRAFKRIRGINVYSNWSKKRSIKLKK